MRAGAEVRGLWAPDGGATPLAMGGIHDVSSHVVCPPSPSVRPVLISPVGSDNSPQRRLRTPPGSSATVTRKQAGTRTARGPRHGAAELGDTAREAIALAESVASWAVDNFASIQTAITDGKRAGSAARSLLSSAFPRGYGFVPAAIKPLPGHRRATLVAFSVAVSPAVSPAVVPTTVPATVPVRAPVDPSGPVDARGCPPPRAGDANAGVC